MEIKVFGVVGAGQMGNGIAQVAANPGGLHVIMNDIADKFVDKGYDTISKNLDRLIAKEKLTAGEKQEILSRIIKSTSLDDMKGGTFTITNGGVFGSMLSTPILNPPQSAILGMHNIVDRPVAVNGQVEIHPIMYVALSYDHRIIDGRESVSFLVKVREMLENPAKMLFNGKDPILNLLGL